MGFDLPKNTGVIANLWYASESTLLQARILTCLDRSMTHSQDIYGDPDVFRLERFLSSELPVPEMSDPHNIIFGHGRRYVALRMYNILDHLWELRYTVTLQNLPWPSVRGGSSVPCHLAYHLRF